MDIRYLGQDEKEKSRHLYETCFPEDSESFVDYYYNEKCRDNQILVMEDFEQVISMIHLNPFTVSLYGQEAKVHYIVAVATDEAYRMHGYMRELMEKVFHDMYEAGEPFTFLTPANPDYYYSCGFEYWDNQIHLQQDQNSIWNGRQRLDSASDGDCVQMAAYSNETLKKQFDLFVKKDEAYYRRLIREQECDGGHLIVIRERENADRSAKETIGGIFCLNKGLGMYIREPVMEHSCTEQIQPVMMGRILNIEKFCAMIRSDEKISMTVRVRDTMIPENSGCYSIEIDPYGGSARKVCSTESARSMDIAELGQFFFHKMRIYINEVV